jgi:NhaA family Na+:H+ antiporter
MSYNRYHLFLIQFSVECNIKAIPLLSGLVLALFLANLAPTYYDKYLGSGHGPSVVNAFDNSDSHRRLAAGATNGPSKFKLSSCNVWGHDLTWHFIANDVVMVFHFALATKEVTEALLPGGSLNPPNKALNPIYCTVGGIVGPVAVYFIVLHAFLAIGWIGPEQQAELSR